MLTLPAPVLNYLLKTTVDDRAPAYLCVSPAGNLNHWGGSLSTYGIGNLQSGQPIASQIFFLEGLLPLEGAELFLPHLKTDAGCCADVYLFPDETCDWVVLLDATANELQNQQLQQCRNQINLLQNIQSQLIQRSLQPSQPSPAMLMPLLQEQRQNLTILFADLRGITLLSEQHAPESLFQLLNLYLRRLIQAIVTEAGLIDQLGNAVIACFGILPALSNAPTHAIQTGLKMLTAVRQLNQQRQAQQQPTLDVGIGIASGATALGMVGDRRYQTLKMLGPAIDRAAAMQQQVNSGEMLIDENTFNQAISMQSQFSAVDRPILYGSASVKVYSTSGSGHE